MRKPLLRYKRFWLLSILVVIIGYLLTMRPVQIILQTASNNPSPVTASPALPDVTIETWTALRRDHLNSLEASLYGSFPSELNVSIVATKTLGRPSGLENAQIQHYVLQVSNPLNQHSSELDFVLISPSGGTNRLILTQNFCPNHDVLSGFDMRKPNNIQFSCAGEGVFSKLMLYFFGRYIVTPPIEAILDNGYALGIMHPPQFIADSPNLAEEQLNSFFSNHNQNERPGALISWAALSTNMAELLSQNYETIVTWGHSRYGKTALLAAAYSKHIDGAIAHQSGTGGASLFRDKAGETLSDIVSGYPHWFGKNADKYTDDPHELPLDQHYLLALIAPKPVLLGNARRDVWSDPEGAFHAAKAANLIYAQFNKKGMTATRLDEFKPEDHISFWTRPGTHGVTEEDWPAFLEFLNNHF